MVMVHEYYRVKKGKDFNLWVEGLDRKCVPIDDNVVCKDPSAYMKILAKNILILVTASHLLQIRNGYDLGID